METKEKKVDQIEEYLEQIIDKYQKQNLPARINRSQSAKIMNCAPTHISYVIHHRLNKDNEYNIITKRGLEGYIQIVKKKPGERIGYKPKYISRYREESIAYKIGSNLNNFIDTQIKPIQQELGLNKLAIEMIQNITREILREGKAKNDNRYLEIIKETIRQTITHQYKTPGNGEKGKTDRKRRQNAKEIKPNT